MAVEATRAIIQEGNQPSSVEVSMQDRVKALKSSLQEVAGKVINRGKELAVSLMSGLGEILVNRWKEVAITGLLLTLCGTMLLTSVRGSYGQIPPTPTGGTPYVTATATLVGGTPEPTGEVPPEVTPTIEPVATLENTYLPSVKNNYPYN